MKHLVIAVLIAQIATTVARADAGGYLFVTFRGEQTPLTEQIFFAVSDDGRHWDALNNAEPVLVSQIGTKGVRDPYLVRAHDGSKFFLIATDLSINLLNRDWHKANHEGSHSIVIWESTDLVKWSQPRLAKVSPEDAGCTLAPEAIYDESTGDYLVYWSSLNGRDNYSKFRVWGAFTKDFQTFSEPFIYIDRPFPTIDADIVNDGKQYVRFSKNEQANTILEETADKLAGPWQLVPGFTLAATAGFEGPACFELASPAPGQLGTWCLLVDAFKKDTGYQPFVTKNLAAGAFEPAGDITFPFKTRHGAVLPITDAEMHRLKSVYARPTTQPK